MECFYIVTVGWVFSLCLHEFAHAWVAYKGGDYTIREKGYLTFNPLKYVDPYFSLVLPVLFVLLGGIGLPGGAVYIERSLLRSRGIDTAVSLAGPLANIVLMLVLGALFKFGAIPTDPSNLLSVSLAFLLHLQVSAIVLNLLPLPPLDGFGAIAPWISESARQHAYSNASVTLFVLFIALSFVPVINNAFWETVYSINALFDVPRNLVRVGWKTYRFWD
jgi:Zn-dependent protease